jgi:hypothetical protein
MRNRIFGLIGVLWGGALTLAHLFKANPGEGVSSEGLSGSVIFGSLLFCVGLWYLIKGDGSRKSA